MALQLNIRLQPKQSMLLDMFGSRELEMIGYGGPRGGGKSGAIRRLALLRRFEYPGTRCAIMRRTFPDLRDNHILEFWQEFPELRQFFNVQNKEITLPKEAGGGVIAFRYAENADDVEQKKGQQYMDLLVDQAEEWTENELLMLKTTNRWPGLPDNACKMGLFFNPGGPGAMFLKRVMVDREFREHENPKSFGFLQAYGWDNVEWFRPYLTQRGMSDEDFYGLTDNERFNIFIADTQYGRVLNKLPGPMRIAQLLGNFDSFAGQFFDVFQPEKHTIRAEMMDIPPWAPRWISIDWGFSHPSAVYWHAQVGNMTCTYREYLRDQLGPKALAQEIASRTRDEKITAVYLSPDAFAKRTDERPIAEQMGDVLVKEGIPRPAAADNDRKGGWMLMYESLRDGNWMIAESCRNLIATLPLLTRDRKDPEDCQKFDASGNGNYDGDDSADSARYGLKSHLRPRKKPESLQRAEELQKAADYTEMHLRALRWDSRHKTRSRRAWRH